MDILKRVYDQLDDSLYSRYSTDATYPVDNNGKMVLLSSEEMLEVGRMDPREHVMIATFKNEPTRVLYYGEDVASVRQTVEKLSLPSSWPNNLGEKVFCLFKGHLDALDSGPLALEQHVMPGKEQQFSMILQRLIETYKEQDNVL